MVLRESLHVEGQWRATHRNAVRSASRNSGGIGLRAALGHKFWWLAATRTTLLSRSLVIGALLCAGILAWVCYLFKFSFYSFLVANIAEIAIRD